MRRKEPTTSTRSSAPMPAIFIPIQGTPACLPSPKPTAKATPKPSAKPTAAPSKKTDTKSDPKQTKKSDGEDVDKRLQAALQRYLGESSEGGGKGFGAARVGGQGMGGGVVRPPEFFVYEKLLRSRIKDAWRWYDTNASLITQVSFEIEPDGMVKNVRLVKGSEGAQSAIGEVTERLE